MRDISFKTLHQFVVWFRDLEALQAAARRMVEHLASRAGGQILEVA
ncbi:hypothetical protein [Paraburkholderia fungorum]